MVQVWGILRRAALPRDEGTAMRLLRLLGLVATVGVVGLISCRWLLPWEIFLLPKGYSGPVLVVWQHPQGEPMQEEAWHTVAYTIDGSGIARVAESRPLGPLGFTFVAFYYVRPDGTRQRLPTHRGYWSTSTERAIVFAGSIGGARMRDGTVLSWRYFCVGTARPGNTCESFKNDNIDALLAQVGAQEAFP